MVMQLQQLVPLTMTTTTALSLAAVCLIVSGAIALWCGHLWADNDRLRDEMEVVRLQEFVKGIRIGRHMAELQLQSERVQMDLDGSDNSNTTKPELRIVPTTSAAAVLLLAEESELNRWYDVTMQQASSDEGA